MAHTARITTDTEFPKDPTMPMPSDADLLQAYYDIVDFVATHPVFSQGVNNCSITIGDGGH